MNDIKIDNEYGKFKLRVSAIIIKDDKILLADSRAKKGFFVYPGGHVELGESTSEAILREIKEEVQKNVQIDGIYCVVENLFMHEGKIFNEINYFYKLKLIEDVPDHFETDEIDKGEAKHHKYNFIKIEDLDSNLLRPIQVTEMLKKDSNLKNQLVFTDNRIK